MDKCVAIVILNWNGWKDTIECLDSLKGIDYSNYKVVIVDNKSTDGSVDKINEYITNSPNIKLIKLDINYGYAKGNNIGIKYAIEQYNPEYVLILNNDTTVTPDFLRPLARLLEGNPKAGLAGPKIVDYYSKVHWQGFAPERLNIFTILMFFTPLYRIFIKSPLINKYLVSGTSPIKVYGIPGCCLLFKTKSIQQIDLFDENTFLGSEEYIIAEKLLKVGYETYVVPQSIVYHKVAQSAEKLEPVEKTIAFLKSERYFHKHYLKLPNYQRVIIVLVRIFIYGIISILNKSYRKGLLKLIKAMIMD